jgi:hypothetical protein
MAGDEQHMVVIDMLRELVDLLSQDAIGVAAIAAHIGPVAADPGVPMPLDLLPRSAILDSAKLSRYPSSGLPYVLELRFKIGLRPTVAALETASGPPSRALTDRGAPHELVYDTAISGRRWRVSMIASLPLDQADGASLVAAIALRRDPVTP